MQQRAATFFNKLSFFIFGGMVCCLLSGCQGGLNVSDLLGMGTPSLSSCWPCTMYKIVFDAIANALAGSYTVVSQMASLLLGIGMLFWLAFKVAGMVSSIKQPNLRDFITSMFGTFFKAIVVAVVLLSPTYTIEVLNMIAEPILKTFIQMSRTVLLSDPTIAKHFTAPQSVTMFSTTAPLLSGEIGYLVQDIVYRIYVALHSGMILGYRLFIGIDFMNYVIGMAVTFTFFYLMLIFPLLFIDSFVRLGCVFIFFPFLLVSWVFPSTKKYIMEGWKTLFGAMMQILVACVYIALIVSIVKTYSDTFSFARQFTDPLLLLGFKTASTEAIGFLALIISMLKLTDKIPAVSGYFGGDASRSEMVKAFQHTTKMGFAMGKMAAAGVMVGTGIGVQGAKKMFKDSGEDLKKAALGGAASQARYEYDISGEEARNITALELYTGDSAAARQARAQQGVQTNKTNN